VTDDLQDRVVVVSGASSGIGLATVIACLQAGALVVAGDIQPSERPLSDWVAQQRLGFVTADLSEAAGPATLIEAALDLHGRVDVLVNNVGLAPYRSSFLDVTDTDWFGTFNLNVMAAVRASRAVLPSMVDRRTGVIISLASDAGRQPDPFFVDYALSKAAILSLSKALSIEFGPYGIRVNTVSPTATLTPALEPFLQSLGAQLGLNRDDTLEHFATRMRALPLGRINTPEDVAEVIVFLASDRARQVTGADYSVNAGSTKYV
jgi:NAD(P)-dependent dehydrogenase (short-subunit alcohol dehydrogenase family)